MKEESEKTGLKLNIQKAKNMASSPITSWQLDWGKNGNWQVLFSWTPKSLNSDWSHKKLVPWKKSYDKPRQSIKKQRYHFADKGLYIKAMVFLVDMYRCESWIIKNTWSTKKLMLSNSGAGEDSWASLGLKWDQTSQSERKSSLNINCKD